jgi:hypothetical protein
MDPKSERNGPESLGGDYAVALQTAEKALFDPFRAPHSGQIPVRSVAQTPFRTVSESVFRELRLVGALGSGAKVGSQKSMLVASKSSPRVPWAAKIFGPAKPLPLRVGDRQPE